MELWQLEVRLLYKLIDELRMSGKFQEVQVIDPKEHGSAVLYERLLSNEVPPQHSHKGEDQIVIN
jgi:hypothetical protein